MANSDKRRQLRIKATGPITIVRASGEQVEGQAIDVSLLGCRLSSATLLELEEQIVTTLRFPSGRSHEVSGTIKSIQPPSPYQYGVAFSPETVEQIIKDFFQEEG